jgi:hypothetical protein
LKTDEGVDGPRLTDDEWRSAVRRGSVSAVGASRERWRRAASAPGEWNQIEHRLFSFISRNCAGTPLRTWELFLAAIRGTTTKGA